MSTIFTKIINGEIPCFKVAENANFIAFLDINPIVKGHTLVVPKKEVDYIFDHDDTILSEILIFSKQVAKSIRSVIECQRIGVSVIGIEVPHTHMHLVPINSVADMNFSGNRSKQTTEELEQLAKLIHANFEAYSAF